MSKNRKGIIKTSMCFIDNLSYDDLSTAFQDIIVLNVELQGFDSLVYYCISKHFEEVEVACAMPEYVINIETNDKGEIIKRSIELS
jgi:hypothetical protein